MPKQQLLRRKHPIDAIPFEAFYHGSWHGLDLVSIKSGSISIQFNYHGSVIEDKICGDYLRLRSRKASTFDCIHFLKAGIDVCVLSAHPIAEGSDQEPQAPLLSWHDAKIISIKRAHQDGRCACRFSVIFYKSKAPTSTIKSTSDRVTEVVTIDNIAILQKLRCEPCEDGFHHWTSSDDCTTFSRSKLLSGTISSEVSWLIVLSILKGLDFDIKLLQNKIVYHIRNNIQWSSIISDLQSDGDSDLISRNSDENTKVVCFQRCRETLRPKIETLPPVVLTENTVPDTTMEDDLIDHMVDYDSDVEILYDYMNLRRSKRRKMLPDRFTSYSSPNFNRCSIKKIAHDTNRFEQSTAMRPSSPVKEDPHQTKLKHSISSSLKHEESSRTSAVLQRKNLSGGKPTKPLSQPPLVEVEDVCEFLQRSSQDGLKLKSTCRRVKKGGIFPSSHKIRHPSSWSDQKKYSTRKKLLSESECKQLIERCMGNIKSETDGRLRLDVEWTTNSQTKFPEELQDFNWSPSDDTQIETQEHEDLWEEMEHSLTTLALLEQKQKLDAEVFTGTTNTLEKNAEQPCQHDYKLNEQIGITCQLCNFICTEIRYVSPPLFQNDGWVSHREKLGREGLRWMGSYDLESDPFSNANSVSEMSSSEVYDNIWTSIPGLESKLHLHQKKAFEFIWRNIAGSLKPEEMNNQSENTGGCVISHSPGSGKTLLVISFLVSYLRLFPKSRPLILAPKIAVYIWCKEFEKWGVSIPVHLIHPFESYKKEIWKSKIKLPSTGDRRPSVKMMHVMDSLVKLQQWHENPSVLLMSYSSFFSLTHKESKINYRRFMADLLRKSPGVLILDEGHNPRSTKSKLRKLLMKVNTEFRILLSGTLFQNNFEEYFNTLFLARPRFLNDVVRELDPNMVNILSGRKQKGVKKMNRKERLAKRLFVEEVGQKIESSVEDERKQGFNMLNRITSGFIDVYEGERSDTLPGLQVYTLMLASSDVQLEILMKLQNSIKQKRCPLELELLITVGSIHPWLIKTVARVIDYFTTDELEKIDKYKNNFRSGSKVKFVVDLVHKSTIRGERVLVFCHNISPINFLVQLFEIVFGWYRGNEVLVLQGDQELFERAKIMDKFNGDSRNDCKVLLASTSACAEGISLTAASRVVLLDSEWNHAKTRQAIARAFRPGQEKVVYVYRLLALGTWEEDKYHTNEWKAWLSKMIFLGQYIGFSSSRQVEDVEDEMLKELVEEDHRKTIQMIMKQD